MIAVVPFIVMILILGIVFFIAHWNAYRVK